MAQLELGNSHLPQSNRLLVMFIEPPTSQLYTFGTLSIQALFRRGVFFDLVCCLGYSDGAPVLGCGSEAA
jgi:hypothetical protein